MKINNLEEATKEFYKIEKEELDLLIETK